MNRMVISSVGSVGSGAGGGYAAVFHSRSIDTSNVESGNRQGKTAFLIFLYVAWRLE